MTEDTSNGPTIAKLRYAYLNVGILSSEELRSILAEAIQALRDADAAPLVSKLAEIIEQAEDANFRFE